MSSSTVRSSSDRIPSQSRALRQLSDRNAKGNKEAPRSRRSQRAAITRNAASTPPSQTHPPTPPLSPTSIALVNETTIDNEHGDPSYTAPQHIQTASDLSCIVPTAIHQSILNRIGDALTDYQRNAANRTTDPDWDFPHAESLHRISTHPRLLKKIPPSFRSLFADAARIPLRLLSESLSDPNTPPLTALLHYVSLAMLPACCLRTGRGGKNRKKRAHEYVSRELRSFIREQDRIRLGIFSAFIPTPIPISS
jgi:hypothetical protein